MVKQIRRKVCGQRRNKNLAHLRRGVSYVARIKRHSRRRHRHETSRNQFNHYERQEEFNGRALQEGLKLKPYKCRNRTQPRGFTNWIAKSTRSFPLVTFIEKHKQENESLGSSNHKNKGMRFQFQLEDGRVDVPQVLRQMGVTKLQYECQPGVWRALKGSSLGKSISKFQNNQDVYFRTDLPIMPNKKVKGECLWVDKWFVEGDKEEDYNARVSRIVQKTPKGRIGVGTMVRVKSSLIPGLMLTCRHCVELRETRSINNKLHAFGGPINVLYVSDKYDLAICEGPRGPEGFRLAEDGEEVKGREIRMLSFPWHVDLVYGLLGNVGPTQVHGQVCMLSPKGCEMPMEVDALGTYMGGFPASSGGAVTLNSKVLCGIHVGVIWHDKDDTNVPLALGSLGFMEPKEPCSAINTFHMHLCAKRRGKDVGKNDFTVNEDNHGSATSQITHNHYCSSSHGYLATYVSSTHIEEVFQDYIKSTNRRH